MASGNFFRHYGSPIGGKQLDLTLKFLSLLLLFTLNIARLINTASSEVYKCNIEEKMLKDDTLSVEIQPAVGNSLWVNYSSSKSGGIRVAIFSNETKDLYSFSLVYVMPKTEGLYNIIIRFSFKGAWNCTVGVYTRNSEFYRKPPVMTSSGPFVLFSGPFGVTAEGDQAVLYEINIVLQVEGDDSSSWFNVKFPTPVNMALFAAISFITAYFNAFFLLDAYFKSKMEGVSKVRWALLGLMILTSIYILYQTHAFMVGE